mgnify:FL=1
MLTASELTALRNTQAQTLTETATIQRKTTVSDGAGGFSDTWATVGSAKCRVAPGGTGTAQLLAGKLNEKSGWRITLPQGTDVIEADRIEVDSRSFEVLSVLGAWTNETARVCLCVER